MDEIGTDLFDAIDLRATQGGMNSRGSARARVLNMGGKQKNIWASQAKNGDFSAAILAGLASILLFF